MKTTAWPTASVIGPKTRVLLAGWSLKTITFVSGTFPALLTTPLKTRGVPGCVGPGGQNLVTVMAGMAHTVHVALLVAQTVLGRLDTSVPHATTVSGNGPHRLPLGKNVPV